MGYDYSFWSLKGQAERLTTAFKAVGSAITSPFHAPELQATTPNKTVNAVLNFVGNNPYTTAGIATIGATGTAGAVTKTLTSGLSTSSKVLLGSGGLVVGGAAATSSATRNALINVASQATPESLVRLGASGGKVIQQPTIGNIKNFASENWGTTSILAGAGLLAGGGTLLNAYSNFANTLAVKANTQATLGNPSTSQSEDNLKAQKKAAKQAADLLELQTKQQMELEEQKAEYSSKLLKLQFESEAQAITNAQKLNMMQAEANNMPTTTNAFVAQESTPANTETLPTTTTPKKKAKKKKTTKKKKTKKKATKKRKALNTRKKKKR